MPTKHQSKKLYCGSGACAIDLQAHKALVTYPEAAAILSAAQKGQVGIQAAMLSASLCYR